jgi:hypothetical protein
MCCCLCEGTPVVNIVPTDIRNAFVGVFNRVCTLASCLYRWQRLWCAVVRHGMALCGINIGINPLTPKLNRSAQHSLTRLFTGHFAS